MVGFKGLLGCGVASLFMAAAAIAEETPMQRAINDAVAEAVCGASEGHLPCVEAVPDHIWADKIEGSSLAPTSSIHPMPNPRRAMKGAIEGAINGVIVDAVVEGVVVDIIVADVRAKQALNF